MQHAGHVVTPEGVRAGEPDALAALCERRGAAVLAYCREVCDAHEAPLAAAEALARFRAAVSAAGDATDLDPERLLLSATRHAAAARARTPADAGTTRRMLGRGNTITCVRMPGLIVARAENLLGSADLDRLSRHLERCPTCRATEAAFRRAERAYVATSHAPLDSNTTALLLAALAEAAPVEPVPVEDVAATAPAVVEPAPAPPEPAPPTATAAFPATEPFEVQPAPAPEPLAAEPLIDELDDADGWAEEDLYDHHMIEPGPATWNATEEPPRRHRRLRVVLPVAVLAAGAAAAMAAAGVFDGGGSAATTTQRTTTAPARTTPTVRHHKKHHKPSARTTTAVTATP